MFAKIALIAAIATVAVSGKTVRRGNQTWFFSSGKTSFKGAEHACRRRHMRIAAINNAGEQRFAGKHTRGHTWIAINDIKHEGRWMNGNKRARYTHWNRGEPNNWGRGGEDCTLMNWGRGGRWNDMRCNYRAKYACKKTARRARHATFANNSFLENHNAFKQAQAARMRYIRQHMKLVRARYVRAHRYFAAKNRAAAARRLVIRWNNAYRFELRRHAKAVRNHVYKWRMMKKAYHAKMRAMHYHRITAARLRSAH
jgi:hypothetical protein